MAGVLGVLVNTPPEVTVADLVRVNVTVTVGRGVLVGGAVYTITPGEVGVFVPVPGLIRMIGGVSVI